MPKWAYHCLAVFVTVAISGPPMSCPEPDLTQSNQTVEKFGPPEGRPAPPLKARDQFGAEQTLRTVAGKDGTVLLFFRSADW
jgi:hypothetical protein